MKKMLEKISYGLCSSYCDNENIAYTERVLGNGQRAFHFINMSSSMEKRQNFTIHIKNGEDERQETLDIGLCEIKEFIV